MRELRHGLADEVGRVALPREEAVEPAPRHVGREPPSVRSFLTAAAWAIALSSTCASVMTSVIAASTSSRATPRFASSAAIRLRDIPRVVARLRAKITA